ncbi:MAG: ABC transporter ATP-binding protein [Rhizomicrobium sp.]
MRLLSVENLTLTYGPRTVLGGLDFTLERGEILALAGTSGSGKSSTALAIARLLPGQADLSGRIVLNGENLCDISEKAMCAVRGGKIGMVFQEPMTALNPVMRIGDQIAETLFAHGTPGRKDARERVATILARVGLTEAGVGPERYPHELSGGQRQRVAIALAIVASPALIIADEPTTALDVTIQAQILELLHSLVREDHCGLLLITHDLGVVAQYADRVALLEDGRIVESGPPRSVFSAPKSDVTRRLIAEAATPPVRHSQPAGERLLVVDNVCHRYRDDVPKAVDSVGFDLYRGESLGVVGESGSGKSTLLRILLGLLAPGKGEVRLTGRAIHHARGSDLADLRRQIQAVFQDPMSSFNPRHRVGRIVAEPLYLIDRHMPAKRKAEKVAAVLNLVGLPADAAGRFPQEFSGGQRQRIAIARALIISPALIVFDEALSALDATARSEIISLLNRLSQELQLSYLFVTHDLDQARAVTDRLIVMQGGHVIESGPTNKLLSAPTQAYTAGLVAAAPNLNRALGKAV